LRGFVGGQLRVEGEKHRELLEGGAEEWWWCLSRLFIVCWFVICMKCCDCVIRYNNCNRNKEGCKRKWWWLILWYYHGICL